MYGVILAGGKGKRFWPVSTKDKPKQLIDIAGTGSMLSITYDRLSTFIPEEKIIVLTSSSLEGSILREVPGLKSENLIAEPAGRNTAPSIALASLIVAGRSGDEPFVTCPADHLIDKEDVFTSAVRAAAKVAEEYDVLVTFGIKPSFPATGYGYIEVDERFDSIEGHEFFRVERFHEKPGADEAAGYLEKGSFYWNSGIFVWRPSVFMAAVRDNLKGAYDITERLKTVLGTGDFNSVLEKEYPEMPSISVDYGVLEKADNVVTVPVDIGWSDVGSWDALFDIIDGDGNGNAVRGRHLTLDSRNNLIFNPEGLTALIGVDDLIVVASKGSVLVCRKGRSQEVKEVVERLESDGMEEYL